MRLEEAIEQAGFSIRRLARCSGVARFTIHRVLNGDRPNYETCVRLARVLGVEPLAVVEFRPAVERLETVTG